MEGWREKERRGVERGAAAVRVCEFIDQKLSELCERRRSAGPGLASAPRVKGRSPEERISDVISSEG